MHVIIKTMQNKNLICFDINHANPDIFYMFVYGISYRFDVGECLVFFNVGMHTVYRLVFRRSAQHVRTGHNYRTAYIGLITCLKCYLDLDKLCAIDSMMDGYVTSNKQTENI